MAEMRLRARPVVLLATVLLLALPAVAAADIKPIPKPANPVTPATPPPPPPPPPAGPVNKPPVNVTPPPATPPAPPATPPSPPAAPPTGNTVAIVVEDVLGGHDQSGVAAPVAPPPDPTPLALVAASEALPSHGSGTPAWKLALLALL
ncbi:MAG: hypothetical protein QOE87_358, partial [Gaiellales bacterium]|nr:hypothetical protein [Gaiellales bacterium]